MAKRPRKRSKDELLKEILEKYPDYFDSDSAKQVASKLDEDLLEYILEEGPPSSIFGGGSPHPAGSAPVGSGSPSSVSSSPIGSGSPSSGASSPIGGGSSGSGCFVATAAYGSSLQDGVVVLAQFRDRYLLENRAGMAFVSIYYRCSPALASYIGKHDLLRAVVRMALHPMVRWSKRFMDRNTSSGG